LQPCSTNRPSRRRSALLQKSEVLVTQKIRTEVTNGNDGTEQVSISLEDRFLAENIPWRKRLLF
jgi:hypothetical protein